MVTICTAYMCKTGTQLRECILLAEKFSVSKLTNSTWCHFLTVPQDILPLTSSAISERGRRFTFTLLRFTSQNDFRMLLVLTIVFKPFHICWLSFFQTTQNNFPSINQPLKDEQQPVPETEIKNEGENAAPLPTPGFFKNVSDRVLKAKVKLLEAPYDVESWNILVKDAQVYNYVYYHYYSILTQIFIQGKTYRFCARALWAACRTIFYVRTILEVLYWSRGKFLLIHFLKILIVFIL